MQTKLVELYRSIDAHIRKVYVFPRIALMSRYNPYLNIFYGDLLSPVTNNTTIQCASPHPLFPLFLIKKLFGEKSIVHYHWLEFSTISGFFVVLWKMKLLLVYRLAGGKIVWSPHNKMPHRSKYLLGNRLFQLLMARIAEKIHVHCHEAVDVMAPLLRVNPDKFCIIQHPLYPVKPVERKPAREYVTTVFAPGMDKDKPIFLMYGNIAKYKGILEVIPYIEPDHGQLIIAGESKKGENEYLRNIEKELVNKEHIRLIYRFISDEEEAYLFGAADCVIFNFNDILSSGSVMLALSYKKTIIVPDAGCGKELSGPNICKFTSPAVLKNLIRRIAGDPVQPGAQR